MRNPSEILVTTTSSIEGVSIKQYIKPISAHVVAGTNFFSDFFASFSDVFGGRSQTYQRQLSSIYTEAVEILKRSAYEIGANCIVGLKVDLDEISGKGKSMFMVTATGTAVIIETNSKNKDKISQQDKLEVISVEKMNELRKRNNIIQLAKGNELEMDESLWEFISENSIYEISSEILEKVANSYFSSDNRDKLYQQFLTYLLSLSEIHRTTLLYDYLMSENSNNVAPLIYRLIKELMVFDSEKLHKYLLDPNEVIKKKALQIVVNDKPFYTKDDVNDLEKFIQIIEKHYDKVGEFSTQKKLLSSKEKEIWVCRCGNKNDIEVSYCGSCNKDIYGYNEREVNPVKAVEILKENIAIIKINIA